MKPHQDWIATSDERRAFLFQCQFAPSGHWRLEQRKSLESQWEHYHEEHRPSALGRGPTANAAQHFASIGHEPEEEHRRFARDVVQWLGHAVSEFGIEHVSLFAASRFLGVLRTELGDLNKQVTLYEAELTSLRTSDLATHPVVIAALQTR